MAQAAPLDTVLLAKMTSMAPENTVSVRDSGAQGGVLLRLLKLPLVSATCQVIEKTYVSTKHSHPVVCTVFETYELGAKTAASLALWTAQPALHKLESKISAVNNLVCKGLDKLEEKIPALQYPPEKLASGITVMVSSTVQSAKETLSHPIASTSSKALSAASTSYNLACSLVTGSMDLVLSSVPIHLAMEGVDNALNLTEHLIDYMLPASEEEMEKGTTWQQESDDNISMSKPSYKRLGDLAGTICHRAYNQISCRIQYASAQGLDVALAIPGVYPLAVYTKRNLEVVRDLTLSLQSSAVGLFTWMEKQSEKKGKEDGEQIKHHSLVSGLGQHLQGAYILLVSSMKSATFDVAKECTSVLLDTLSNSKNHVLSTMSYYGLFPGLIPEDIPETSATNELKEMTVEISIIESSEPTSQEQQQGFSAVQNAPSLPTSEQPAQTIETQGLQQQEVGQISMKKGLPMSGPNAAAAQQEHRHLKGKHVSHSSSCTPSKKQ
ncbi:perilipin-1 isoform X1 [Arapaima gigas]